MVLGPLRKEGQRGWVTGVWSFFFWPRWARQDERDTYSNTEAMGRQALVLKIAERYPPDGVTSEFMGIVGETPSQVATKRDLLLDENKQNVHDISSGWRYRPS